MNPQAHRSTEELKTIVKALSKLRFLNTPEEDQRLFECKRNSEKEKEKMTLSMHTFKLLPINHEYTTPRRHATTNL